MKYILVFAFFLNSCNSFTNNKGEENVQNIPNLQICLLDSSTKTPIKEGAIGFRNRDLEEDFSESMKDSTRTFKLSENGCILIQKERLLRIIHVDSEARYVSGFYYDHSYGFIPIRIDFFQATNTIYISKRKYERLELLKPSDKSR